MKDGQVIQFARKTKLSYLRCIRLGGSAGSNRNGYRRTRQSHRKTNSEYRRDTGAPLYIIVDNEIVRFSMQMD